MIALLLPITIGLLGKFDSSELARWVGPQYRLQQVSSLDQAASLEIGTVVMNRLPQAEKWAQVRDGFVSRLEKEIWKFKSGGPQKRVFVLLPTTAPNFSKDTLETEVVPLLRQAAEETSAEPIDIQTGPPENEQIAEAIIDFAGQKSGWKLVSADSEESDEGPAINAIDGKPSTYWHTRYSPKDDKYPHQLVVDMGADVRISGFRYLPRQDGGTNGRIKKFEFYVSGDGSTWGPAAATGTFLNTPRASLIHFEKPVSARYFKFVAISEQGNGPWASAAEIDVLPSP